MRWKGWIGHGATFPSTGLAGAIGTLDNPLDLAIFALRAQRDRHGSAGAVTPEPAVASVESRDQLALFAGGFPALSLAVIGDTRRIGVGVVIDVPPFDRPVEGYLRPTISC